MAAGKVVRDQGRLVHTWAGYTCAMRWLASSLYVLGAVAACSNDPDKANGGNLGGASGSGGDAGASGDSSAGAAGAPDGAAGTAGRPSDSGGDTGCQVVRGCQVAGCAGSKICSTDPRHGCHPSSCSCAEDGQVGGCTNDCGGGVCVDSPCVGCPLDVPQMGSDCSAYELGKYCTYAQQTNHCDYFTGGTSSGRYGVTCDADGGAPRWRWGGSPFQ